MVKLQYPLKIATSYVVNVFKPNNENEDQSLERLRYIKLLLGSFMCKKIAKGYSSDQVTLTESGRQQSLDGEADQPNVPIMKFSFHHPTSDSLLYVSKDIQFYENELPHDMSESIYMGLSDLCKNTLNKKYERHLYIISGSPFSISESKIDACKEMIERCSVNVVLFTLTDDRILFAEHQHLAARLNGHCMERATVIDSINSIFPTEISSRASRKMQLSLKSTNSSISWSVAVFRKCGKEPSSKLKYSKWCKLCDNIAPPQGDDCLRTETEYYIRKDKDAADDAPDIDDDNEEDQESLFKFPPIEGLIPISVDDLQTAYKYGDKIVSGLDFYDSALKLYETQGIEISHFVPRNLIHRELFVSGVSSLVLEADSSDLSSRLFVSFCVAMEAEKVVAICRHCLPNKIRMALLWPRVLRTDSKVSAELAIIFLPFANEINHFLASDLEAYSLKDAFTKLEIPQELSNLPKEEIQEKAQTAMDQFVLNNSLETKENCEPLNEFGASINPSSQRLSQCFYERLLQNYDPIKQKDTMPHSLSPPLIQISKQVEPLSKIDLRQHGDLLKFIRLRPPQPVQRRPRSSSDKLTAEGQDIDLSKLLDADYETPDEEAASPKKASPIDEFHRALNSTGVDYIDEATQSLLAHVTECVNDSSGNLLLAFQYLMAVREKAIEYDLVTIYNDFLIQLKRDVLTQTSRGKLFWGTHFVPNCRKQLHFGLLPEPNRFDNKRMEKWFKDSSFNY